MFVMHRRRAVQERTVNKWPGNNIPIFRKNEKALKELPAGFGRQGIRKHILDTLTERRRIHKGHDFEKVLTKCHVFMTEVQINISTMEFYDNVFWIVPTYSFF